MTVVDNYTVDVAFAGSGIKSALQNPNAVTLTQKEYAHDTLQMEYWGGDIDSDSIKSGLPVQVTIGRPTGARNFYGYVNHPERLTNRLAHPGSPLGQNSLTVTCLGASWLMKQAGNLVFQNQTASQVVAQIAAKFKLDTNITNHPTVWASLQMGGESYWQFCVNLAHRIGYTFYCNGVQLVFKQRQTNPHNLAAIADVFDYSTDGGQFISFTPQTGATSPAGGQLANRTLAGINPRTNQVVYSQMTGSPSPTVLGTAADLPVFERTEHFTVSSQEEADIKASGAGALNQLYITAQAQVVGNPFVSQGSMIAVANANGSQNGLWWVTCAEHCITPKTYALNLTLGRDSVGSTPSMSIKPNMEQLPTAVLHSGTWVAG